MNLRIRRLAVVFIAMYGVLFLQFNRWQVLEQGSLVDNPRNNRVTARQFNRPRGQIVTADGTVVAETTRIEGAEADRFQWQRRYPQGPLYAAITGHYTLDFGATQIERTENDVLAGVTAAQQLAAADDLFAGDLAGTVHLTVRDDLQRLAAKQLDGRVGSVVMLDPRSGAVLAMYSNPTYDPNLVAVHDAGEAKREFDRLADDPEKPLLANAYQERYMPGSTFKILTSSIGLETGVLTMETVFPEEKAWVPPNTDDPIQNFGKRTCGGTLEDVFARSCNIPFARTAVDIGPAAMVAGAESFGVGETLPFDLPAPAASTFGGDAASFADSLALLAIHGFGQGSVQMVPLHMAMIAATVANNGVMMSPHVVADTRSKDGAVLSRTQPRVWKTPMTSATASSIRQMMTAVAVRGTASCCLSLSGGQSVAAKTGTAQLFAEGPQRSHAWIVAFAPAESPRVAVAVMLKGVDAEISAGTGGRLAGPIADKLLEAALAVVE